MDSSKKNDITSDQENIPMPPKDPAFPALPENASVEKLVYAKEHNDIEKYVNVENGNFTIIFQLNSEADGGGKIPFSISGNGQQKQLPQNAADVAGLIADTHNGESSDQGQEAAFNLDTLWPDEVDFKYYNIVVYGDQLDLTNKMMEFRRDQDRCLSSRYTEDEFVERYGKLRHSDRIELVKYPTIFMSEVQKTPDKKLLPGQFVYFGFIDGIYIDGRNYRLEWHPIYRFSMDPVLANMGKFEIYGQWNIGETTESHWTLKPLNIIDALKKYIGITIPVPDRCKSTEMLEAERNARLWEKVKPSAEVLYKWAKGVDSALYDTPSSQQPQGVVTRPAKVSSQYYNLIVSKGFTGVSGTVTIDPYKALVDDIYTDPEVCESFRALSNEDIEEIKTMPSLFVTGKTTDNVALDPNENIRIGFIDNIDLDRDNIQITWHSNYTIKQSEIDEMSDVLKIVKGASSSELMTEHWAIKKVDLRGRLHEKDYDVY
jgi:hypothetical protein